MNWHFSNIGSVTKRIRNGLNIKQSNRFLGLPITRIETISNQVIDPDRIGFGDIQDGQKSDWYLQAGEILFSHINSEERIGNCALYEGEPYPLIHGMNLLSLTPDGNLILAKFLLYYIRSSEFRQSLRPIIKRAVNQASVSIGNLKDLPVPLPPLSEQHRIVEILDQADALRKKRAEADAKAARVLPALFYKMFGDPLALLSARESVPIGELEIDLQNGFACGEKNVEDGVPHLRMNNIDDAGVLNLELVRTVPYDRDMERYRLLDRDVLFMGTNSEDKVGKACLFVQPDDRAYLLRNHLFRLRVQDARITPEYLAGFLHLLWVKKFFPAIAKRWVNQASVAQSSVAALRISLPNTKLLHLFTSAYHKLISLRAQREYSGQKIDQVFNVLLHSAFTGDLTAKWREVHMKELLTEVEEQAKALGDDR